MKNLLILLILSSVNFNYAQTSFGMVDGTVWNEIEGDYATFVIVRIFNSDTAYSTLTDFDGRFRINNVLPGKIHCNLR